MGVEYCVDKVMADEKDTRPVTVRGEDGFNKLDQEAWNARLAEIRSSSAEHGPKVITRPGVQPPTQTQQPVKGAEGSTIVNPRRVWKRTEADLRAEALEDKDR